MTLGSIVSWPKDQVKEFDSRKDSIVNRERHLLGVGQLLKVLVVLSRLDNEW